MVFQDTLSSLNPRLRVGTLLEEPLIVQGMGDGEERRQKVMEILGMVDCPMIITSATTSRLSGGRGAAVGHWQGR